MRPAILSLTLLVSLSACEVSTDPFIGFDGGGAITAAQATGNWSFTVQRTTTFACASPSLANGQILTAHLEVLADGTVTGTTSFWQTAAGAGGVVSGFINLASGVTTPPLTLAATAGSAMELQGTFNSAGTFSGTLADPKAGSLPVFAACAYSTAGVKTG